MELREKLLNLQNELKCNKAQYNSFGKYAYRSCEDILEAVKPLLSKYKITMTIEDELTSVIDRVFIKATAILQDCESESVITNTAFAELDNHKGMSLDQCTGTASSYARKYALNGLYLIDDTKDADTDEYHNETTKKESVKKPSTSEQKMLDKTDLMVKIMSYEMKGLDITKVTTRYKVESLGDMNIDQMKDALNILKKQYGE